MPFFCAPARIRAQPRRQPPQPAAADSTATEVAETSETSETSDQEIDAASGATSVPNETSFNGILVIPPQHHATVTLTMGGSIRSTSLLAGAHVKRGSVLATLENPEFIALQQSYLDSHAQNEYLRTEFLRQQTLSREGGLLAETLSSKARPSISRCAAAWTPQPPSWPCWASIPHACFRKESFPSWR